MWTGFGVRKWSETAQLEDHYRESLDLSRNLSFESPVGKSLKGSEK